MSRLVQAVVHGRGGHASMPHKALNPILVLSRLAKAFDLAPGGGLSVRLVAVSSGEKGNVIPDEAVLTLFVDGEASGLSDATAEERLRGVCARVADETGASIDLRVPAESGNGD